jgi:hypothetical protein
VNVVDMDGPTWKVEKRDNLMEKRLKINDGSKLIVDPINDMS